MRRVPRHGAGRGVGQGRETTGEWGRANAKPARRIHTPRRLSSSIDDYPRPLDITPIRLLRGGLYLEFHDVGPVAGVVPALAFAGDVVLPQHGVRAVPAG